MDVGGLVPVRVSRVFKSTVSLGLTEETKLRKKNSMFLIRIATNQGLRIQIGFLTATILMWTE